MSRGDLTDTEWRILNRLLPNRGERGPAIADKRRTMNGILWVLRTGAPWRDLPVGGLLTHLQFRPLIGDCLTAESIGWTHVGH